MKRISIKDIAKQAGVVPSTVSFVLNGKAKQMRISDELAEKIRGLIDASGYQPHHTAVSLRTGKTKILGLIVEDISNVFFATLAKSIEDAAYSLGYRIVYCSTENDPEKGKELIKMLTHQQVDGYLITPTPGMETDINNLIKNNKPVVLMDRFLPGLEVPFTLVDNYVGVQLGMEHLLERGYKHIAFVTLDTKQVQMLQREKGYTDTLERHGIAIRKEWIEKIPFKSRPEDAIKQISGFIKGNPDIDAIFFATNYLGMYGLESIKKVGLLIPEELGVICFDDHDIFRLFTPAITIIRQPIEEIAKTAIDLLVGQLENSQTILRESKIYKHPELVIRSST